VGQPLTAGIEADTNKICSGESLLLRATGGRGSSEYLWTPATGLSSATLANPVANPTTTTTYVVAITEGVCTDTAQFTLVVTPSPEAKFFASQEEGCAPLSVYFAEDANNGTNYIWTFSDGSPLTNEAQTTHVFEAPGAYPVVLRVIGDGGCEAVSAPFVVRVNDGANADFTAVPAQGARLPLPEATVAFSDASQNAGAWFWNFGDGTVSAEANPTHTFTGPGTYFVTLTVTDVNGCVSSVSYGPFTVFVPTVDIPNVFSPNDDTVNDVFRITYEGNEPVSITVFDRWGRTWFTGDAPTDVWNGTSSENGNVAPEGVYFYHIRIGDKDFTGNVTLFR
jgi:gliding motility-associated-like protein